MKQNNITILVRKRECNGCWKENSFSRVLFSSKQREYKLSLRRLSCGKILNYDGYLYLSSYREWFQGCFFNNNKPHIMKLNFLEDIHGDTRTRVKGVLRYKGSKVKLNDTRGLELGYYNESLFLLTSLSFLVHYELLHDKWKLRQNLCLSSRFSFEHIDYDIELKRFYVKSKRFPSLASRDILYCFTLFDVAPFKFIGSFVLKMSTFGFVKEAYIRFGLLIVLVKNTYNIFDLEDLLKTTTVNADEHTTLDEAGIPQEYANQLCANYSDFPITAEINELPTVLYQLSYNREFPIGEFYFGGFPWSCLVNKQNSVDFIIYSLSSTQTSTAEFYDHEENINDFGVDENRSFFHSDDSGRVLCISGKNIRCFKLCLSLSTCISSNMIKNSFAISFESSKNKSQSVQPRFARYGRSLSKIRLAADTRAISSQIVHAVDFHEVIDALAILYTEANQYFIGFYDNQNGAVLRSFSLNETVAENDDHTWSLFVDEFVLICVLKCVARNRGDKCFIYQLVGLDHLYNC